MLAELGVVTTGLLGKVTGLGLGNSDKQLSANEAIESLSSTLQRWAEETGKDSESLLSKLASLGAITSSLSTSLKAYQSQSQARLARDVEATKASVKNNIMQAVLRDQGETGGLGSRLLGVLDNFEGERDSVEVLLGQQSAAKLQMDALLGQLGAKGRAELKDLMERIARGEMSAEEAVSLAGSVSYENFHSLGSIADMFMNLLTAQIAAVGEFIEEAAEALNKYSKSAKRSLGKKEVVLMNAAGGLREVSSLAGTLSAAFEADANQTVTKGNFVAGTISQVAAGTEDEIKAVENMLEASVKKAAEKIEQIKKNETNQIRNMTVKTEQRIAAMIGEFRSVHNLTAKTATKLLF